MCVRAKLIAVIDESEEMKWKTLVKDVPQGCSNAKTFADWFLEKGLVEEGGEYGYEYQTDAGIICENSKYIVTYDDFIYDAVKLYRKEED